MEMHLGQPSNTRFAAGKIAFDNPLRYVSNVVFNSMLPIFQYFAAQGLVLGVAALNHRAGLGTHRFLKGRI